MNKKITFFALLVSTLIFSKSQASIHYRVINHTMIPTDSLFYDLDIDSEGTPDGVIVNWHPDFGARCLINLGTYDSMIGNAGVITGLTNAASTSGSSWIIGPAIIAEACCPHSCSGKERYILIQFQSSGNRYYGWIRMYTSATGDTAIIKSLAYDEIPDTHVTPGSGDPSPIYMVSVPGVNTENKLDYFISRTKIMISNYKGEKKSMGIYDLTGRVLFNRIISNNTYPISLHEGIYIVRFIDEKGQVQTDKVFVQ